MLDRCENCALSGSQLWWGRGTAFSGVVRLSGVLSELLVAELLASIGWMVGGAAMWSEGAAGVVLWVVAVWAEKRQRACRKQAVGGRTAKGSRNRRAGQLVGTRKELGSGLSLCQRRSVGGEVVSPCGLGRGHVHMEQKQAVGGRTAKGSRHRR